MIIKIDPLDESYYPLIAKYSCFTTYLRVLREDATSSVDSLSIIPKLNFDTKKGIADAVTLFKTLSTEEKSKVDHRIVMPISIVLSDLYEYFGDNDKEIDEGIYSKHGVASLILFYEHIGESTLSISGVEDDLIAADMPACLLASDYVLLKVVDKLEVAKEESETFFKKYLQPIWDSFFLVIYCSVVRFNIEMTTLKRCLKLFPHKFIQTNVEKYGELFRFGMIAQDYAIYILGLPYSQMLIDTQAIFELTKQALADKEKWRQKVAKYNDHALDSFIKRMSLYRKGKLTVINDKNTLLENVNEYPPDDIVRIVTTDNKIFQFTLCELPSLIQTKKNPYNMERFDPHIVRMMSNLHRCRNPKIEPMTVIEFLESVYEPDKTLKELIVEIKQMSINQLVHSMVI